MDKGVGVLGVVAISAVTATVVWFGLTALGLAINVSVARRRDAALRAA